jgi:hypothetical protein
MCERDRGRWHSRTMCQDCLIKKLRVLLIFSAFFDFFPPYPSPNRCSFLCPSNYFLPYISSCLLLLFELGFSVFVHCLRHYPCSGILYRPVPFSMPNVRLFTCPCQRFCSSPLSFSPLSYALSFFLCICPCPSPLFFPAILFPLSYHLFYCFDHSL